MKGYMYRYFPKMLSMLCCVLMFSTAYSESNVTSERFLEGDGVIFEYLNVTYEIIHESGHSYAKLIKGDPNSKYGANIPNIKYDGKFYPIEVIGEGAYENYDSILEMYIPNFVKRIEKNAFKNCHFAVGLYFLDNENCIDVCEGAFENVETPHLSIGANLNFVEPYDSKIKVTDSCIISFLVNRIDFSKFDVSGVTKLESRAMTPPIFNAGTSKELFPCLKEMSIPLFTKDLYQEARFPREGISYNAIIGVTQPGNSGEYYISNPEFTDWTVNSFSYSAEIYEIPEFIDYYDMQLPVAHIGKIYSEQLKKVIISSNIRDLDELPFKYCQNLTDVIILDSENDLIQDFTAFSVINSVYNPLKYIYIGRNYIKPGGPANRMYDLIGRIETLEEVIYGENVTEIATETFGIFPPPARMALKNVYSLNPTPPKALMCFYFIPDDVVLHVPVGSSELYSKEAGWNKFNNIREDMSRVEGLKDSPDDGDVTFYDMYGRRVKAPLTGQLVIKIVGGKSTKMFLRNS